VDSVVKCTWFLHEGYKVYLEPPLRHGKSLSGREKPIFRRSFDGVQKG